MKAFVIAGTHSGVGKTTVSIGLMAEFKRRGLAVQAFKIGPDYIDPSYHRLATGRPSRNLDTWLCSKKTVQHSFARAALDVNVVEGVMGLFDGAKNGKGSTAETAALLGLPVILVVDAKGMAQSAGALVQGFAQYQQKTRIAGVIFNRVASEGHYEYLKNAVKTPSLGWIAKNEDIALPERHLGLVPANERVPDIERIRQTVVAHLDLDKLLRLSKIKALPHQKHPIRKPMVRIGYALDAAFHFYYQENLDLLSAAGAELVPFSPLEDKTLPDVDLLYLGGGFPELFEKTLLKNTQFCKALCLSKKPIYAECGGLYYLSLIGLIPGKMEMRDRLQHFGYAKATAQRDTCLLRAGETVKGHMFHYSHWDGSPNLYTLEKRGKVLSEGFADANIHASYLHVHFASRVLAARGNPILARRLVLKAKIAKKETT